MKESIKVALEKVLREQAGVNWLIVHEIARRADIYPDIEFSFVDGKERRDEPFGTNQGYISAKSKVVIDNLRVGLLELAKVFNNDPNALANLYIITCRLSYHADDDESILHEFVNSLSTEVRQRTFQVLINALNNSYYKEHRLFSDKPVDVESWLNLFNSVEYLHTISNPVPQCLKLVVLEGERAIDFSWVKKMKPLLCAVTMGQYGYDLIISKQDLFESYKNDETLIFLAACVLDDTGPDKEPPLWLDKNLVKAMIERWELIGRLMFVHVFGISYRNKNSNRAYHQLGDLIHGVLESQLMVDEIETHEWISKQEFPNNFIAFFWWIKSKNIDINQIPDAVSEKVATQFLNELERIIDATPEYFVNDRKSDPLTTYQLSEEKYGLALVYLLLFLIHSNEGNVIRFKSICMRIKPFYYGAYQARLFATRLTEVILLIFLTAESISNFDEIEGQSIKKYLKVLSDTLLVSYVHLEEREDEVWNPQSERQILASSAGRYLVTTAMRAARKSPVGRYYVDFFDSLSEVAIAKWVE